ncbi:MAG: FtsX-like permease family protein [Planctomycetota bacterium]
MSLTSFIVWRNWASSRLRVLLTLLGIALGVAIVVAIHVMDHNTIQSRLRAQDGTRGAVDLELLPSPPLPPAEVLTSLGRTRGIAAVSTWREARATATGQGAPVAVAVYGFAPLPPASFGHYVVARGRDLVAGDADPAAPGCLLGAAAARELGVDVGGSITLAEPAVIERVECRDGQMVPIRRAPGATPYIARLAVVGVLAEQRLGKREQGLVAVVGHGIAEQLLPLGSSVYHVQREDGADLDRLRLELRERFVVQDARAALLGEGADERAFRNGLKVLGGLALLLGMYVVFQTLAHSLVARIRQLGLLRCLGAGGGAITRIFLFDAAMLGVVGSALGVALGLLLAKALQSQRVSSLGLGKQWDSFLVPLFPVGWTFVLGVLFTLAGAMFPLVRARQIPALDILRARGMAPGVDDGVDLLRGVHLWMFGLLCVALPLAYLAMTPLASEEAGELRVVLLQLVGVLAVFGGVLLLAPGLTSWLGRALLLPLRPFLPMSSWLVGKVLARSAGRVAAAVAGLAAVLLAILGLKTLTHSLHAEVSQFAATTLRERVFVRTTPTTPQALAPLATLPGVERVELYEGEDRSGGFLLRGLAPAAAAGREGPLEGDQETLRKYADGKVRGLVASSRLARVRGWRPGSLAPMRDRNGDPVVYEVIAIDDRAGFDADERAFAVCDPRWLRADFCVPETCVTLATLRLRPGNDPEAAMAAARAAAPTVTGGKSGAWVEGYLRRDVGKDFRLFDILLVLMLLLAGLGLVNGMTIAALGRIRELGVLRALGIRRAALVGSFLLEGAVVAAVASLLACGLGAALGSAIVLGMNRVARMDAPVTMPTPWFVLAPALAFGVALVAAAVPAARALRASPSESVRHE